MSTITSRWVSPRPESPTGVARLTGKHLAGSVERQDIEPPNGFRALINSLENAPNFDVVWSVTETLSGGDPPIRFDLDVYFIKPVHINTLTEAGNVASKTKNFRTLHVGAMVAHKAADTSKPWKFSWGRTDSHLPTGSLNEFKTWAQWELDTYRLEYAHEAEQYERHRRPVFESGLVL